MNFRKILSVIVGFGTIGLLSSVFAKMQGMLFPSSLEIFINQELADTNVSQFIIKLFCVWVSWNSYHKDWRKSKRKSDSWYFNNAGCGLAMVVGCKPYVVLVIN